MDFAMTEKTDRYHIVEIVEPLAVSAREMMAFCSDAAANRAVQMLTQVRQP
jgi:hypothetical protein